MMNKKISKIKILKQKYADIDPFIFDLVLSHTTHKTKEFLYSHPEYNLNLFEIAKLKFYLNKIKKGFPYHYLTKNKDFYNLNFFVNKNTLIPRPETEIMVEEAIKEVNCHSDPPDGGEESNTTLIDIGTGTGCIPISILKNTNYKPNTFAVDISKKALKIAQKNARKHNVQISFLRGNLLLPILKKLKSKNLIITANLPYITKKQFKNEPSIQHEPKTALIANNGGLKLYKELLKQFTSTNNNISATIYFEINPVQATKIKTLIKEYLPKADIQIKKDLSGLDRLVIIKTQS